jgi:hypothetical protein
LLDRHSFGVAVKHGDVRGAIDAIEQLLQTSREELNRMGSVAQQVLGRNLSQEILCGRMCEGLELAFGG